MPTSATIISATNHTTRSVIFLTDPSPLSQILTAGLNKLRLKKPIHAFLPGGTPLLPQFSLPADGPHIFYLTSGSTPFTPITTTKSKAPINIVATLSHISPDSYTQLKSTAGLPSMIRCVGMPDLHPGAKFPIGAVFHTKGLIYPELIGGDLGCGMTVFRTGLKREQVEGKRGERLAKLLTKEGMEGGLRGREGWAGVMGTYLTEAERDIVSEWDDDVGSIGGGNHFAELQVITHLAVSSHPLLEINDVVLVVHSGSRRFGQHILLQHPKPIPYPSTEASAYLKLHNTGLAWARTNRLAIAYLFFSCLENTCIPVPLLLSGQILDLCHNYVRLEDPTTGLPSTDPTAVLVHRKGAAAGSNTALAIIPGSRGTLTAYVRPTSTVLSAFSLSHGAGRSASRKDTAKRMAEKYPAHRDLEQTKLGGIVVCEDKSLLYEEAPEGYKDVGAVVADLEEAGEVEVVAWGTPRISYKVRK